MAKYAMHRNFLKPKFGKLLNDPENVWYNNMVQQPRQANIKSTTGIDKGNVSLTCHYFFAIWGGHHPHSPGLTPWVFYLYC